jgi:carboxypeptidase family protein
MKRVQARSVLLFCAAWLLVAAGAAAAQEFRGTFRGQVVDASGGALPGATVNVQNVETNEVATATTNQEGNYTIPFLRPGNYTLTVEMNGFNKHVRSGLQLQVGASVTINVQMAVGGLTEEVSVTAESPVLETNNANRGQVIDNKFLAELPMQARNPFALSVLVAGVNYNAQAIYLRPFDNGALADWSINGGQNRNNEFLLDGAPNNANQGGNNIAYVPPASAVQEFKIQTNSYDAQYGRTAGGVVNVSIKSGSNTLHGEGYEYYRRKFLDANSFLLNTRAPLPGETKAFKADHYYDQYGFSLDGPVRIPGLYNGTNKTFFLFTGERYREGTPNALIGSTPTAAMRNGDFSNYRDVNGNLILVYDPATGRQEGNNWVRDPFPNNIIPQNRIDPLARKILDYYPLPNKVTPGVPEWQSNLAYDEHINRDVFWNWIGKVDHNFGANNRTFFRYAKNERQEIRNTTPIRTGPGQNGQLPLIRANTAAVGDWVHTRGNTVFNMRASYTYYLELSRADAGFGFDSATLGFPPSLVSQLPRKLFPIIELSDNSTLGRGISENANYIWTIQPNISMNRGRHSIRSGLDIRSTHVQNRNSGEAGMRLTFNRGFTQRVFNTGENTSGSGIASLLLGAPGGGNIDNNVQPDYLWSYVAPWVQDDWKISSRLTLNLGFRWDFNSPVGEKNNQLNYIFDPTLTNPVTSRMNAAAFPAFVPVKGGLTFVGVEGNPERPWKWDMNNIQGRIGAAYQLNDKTVLRGGYGRYYLNPTGQGFNNGFSISTPFISSNDSGRTPLYNLGNPFPNGVIQAPGSSLGALTFLGRGPGYANTGFKVPNIDHVSFGIQRELPWRTSIEVSYAGSREHGVQSSFGGINEPSLDFLRACDVTRGGNRQNCDQLITNPFFGVAGFEGTSRFTNATISRFELARPYPAFTGITETERNDGKLTYDSLQVVGNKRMSKGLSVNVTWTYVPRWEEVGGFIDNNTKELNVGPYFAHRKHRVTAAGVWEIPGKGLPNVLGYVLGGWSLAPVFIFQSGQPWDLPGNVELVGDASLHVHKGNGPGGSGQFIYGVQPCVSQRNATTGNYDLLPVSVNYGCTQAFFVVREAFQTRSAPFRDDRYRRPHFAQLDLNFAKTTRITDKMRVQFRVEAFNVFNSPMYDERGYNTGTTNADFGRINRNSTTQSNFQRFVQLGARFLF